MVAWKPPAFLIVASTFFVVPTWVVGIPVIVWGQSL
jgi:hypothetical protein